MSETTTLAQTLTEIARQKMPSEMDDDQAECADYEFAYGHIVGLARTAVSEEIGRLASRILELAPRAGLFVSIDIKPADGSNR